MTLPIGLASALFNTLVDAIKAAPGVVAYVGDRIYDVPPEKAVTPYIFFGPAGFTDARDIGCSDAWRFRLRIYVSTAHFGRLVAWDIGLAIAEALHEKSPPVPIPGFHMPMTITVVNGGDIIDPLKLKEVFIDIDAVIAADAAN
jgi:hypothetical protein